jgi:hypothetical protein
LLEPWNGEKASEKCWAIVSIILKHPSKIILFNDSIKSLNKIIYL